ncbi:MAG: cation diffusion facilitator family transporter [Rhodospirillales bacterium]|nr:cation diffusion facilitator family transporter [Rhodospirillales bacterium]
MHEHHHDHHAPAPRDFGAAFALGTALNAGFVAAELVFGLAAHATALMADAVHNAGDVLGLLLAWGAAVLARRLPSQARTYGWGRGSILAALVNAAVLLIGVGAVALAAAQRLLQPAPVDAATVVWVALAGVAVNGVTAWLFAGGGGDLNIRATFLHMASDAAVSSGVVVAALLIGATGATWIDPLASLLIVAVVVAGTWGVLRDAVNLAMDGVPAGIATVEVERYLRQLPGVMEVHDLHIWALSTTQTALTAHVVHDGAPPADAVIRQATRELAARFAIDHATLQMETPHLAHACRLRPADVV